MKFDSKTELIEYAKQLVGKQVKDLLPQGEILNHKDKGNIGALVEENYFGYSRNSESRPDFPEFNLELKVTPVKKNKNGTLAAKERLVLGMIDYDGITYKSFEQSDFWSKNKELLLIFYLFEDDTNPEDFRFVDALDYTYPSDDLDIIKQDYEILQEKVLQGDAHTISESDTNYLGACVKGATAIKSLTTQPNSNILAKRRAFSLKSGFVTTLIRNRNSEGVYENILNQNESTSIEQSIIKRLNVFKYQNLSVLFTKYKINPNAKQKYSLLVKSMLGLESIKNDISELQKSNTVIKTVVFDEKFNNKESMSFPVFKFEELYDENWEDSTVRDYFDSTKFLFLSFLRYEEDIYFIKANIYKMSQDILDNELYKTWKRTKDIIRNGTIIKKINGMRRITNFPNSTESHYFHIRPHASSVDVTYPLPVNDLLTNVDKYTQHCFWFNKKYVKEIVFENELEMVDILHNIESL